MKLKQFIFFILALVLFFTPSLHAESVFLKDGSIVEGSITTENYQTVTVTENNGRARAVPRKDILRTLFTDDYKKKLYFQLDGGDEVEGYIVDEDATTYIVRRDLYSPKETIVLKKKVLSSSKKRPVPKRPQIAVSARPVFIVPLFSFRDIARYGTGGTAAIDWLGINGTGFRLGIRGGCWYLFPSRPEFSRIVIAPLTLRAGHEFTITKWLTLVPTLDAGVAYNSMISKPSIIRKTTKDDFEPLIMAGLDVLFFITKNVAITIGAEYGIIIEKNNALQLVSLQAGVEGRF